MTSTEGLTATCVAALGLPNLICRAGGFLIELVLKQFTDRLQIDEYNHLYDPAMFSLH